MIGTEPHRLERWTKEQEAELRRHWEEIKLSARTIGVMMGKTRSSIIGKAHRLGLEQRRQGGPRLKKKFKSASDTPKRRQTNFNLSIRRAPRPMAAVRVIQPLAEIVPVNGVGIGLLEINMRQCHAVVKEHVRATSELARYCGHPVMEGESYCADHYVAFHTPPRPRNTA